jgi:hypothetical protein
MRVLLIDPQIANTQILLVSQSANLKSANFPQKKFPPFVAKLSKSQLQVCLAEFLFEKNLN